MESVLELKGKLQNVYAQYSTYIDKAVRFVLAFVAFFMINREIGYMHMLANPVVALGLAVICAFLPPIFTLVAGAVLTMAHVYSVSLGMLIVTALLFVIMYVFYLRFAPKTAIVVLVIVTAYIAKVPAAALVGIRPAWHTGICSAGSTWNDCVLYDSPGEKVSSGNSGCKEQQLCK